MASSHGEYVLTNEEEQKMKKSVLALLLAVIMTASLLTVGAFADDPVASIGNVTYDTLQDAVDNATVNDTIMVLKDVDISTSGLIIPADKSLILDINGKEIKVASTENGRIDVKGSLTIKDSTDINEDGTGTGKIYTETDYGAGAGYCLVASDGENALVTLESGYIYAVRPDAANKGQFGLGVLDGGDLTVTGGKVEAGWYAISGNGTDNTTNSIINILDGVLVSTADYAVYLPQSGTTNISGGTIYGEAGGVCVQRGDLNISGDVLITSKGLGNTGNWGDGTGGLDCAALHVNAAYGECDVDISGGKLVAENSAIAIETGANYVSGSSIAIVGGEFSSDVSKFVPEGMKQGADGKVVIDTEKAVASIGEVGYPTLEAALDAAAENDTVTLLTDYDPSAYVIEVKDKNITLDLGGNVLTAQIDVIGSKLNIKNGTIDSPLAGPYLDAGAAVYVKASNSPTASKDDCVLNVESTAILKGYYGILVSGPDYSSNEAYGATINVEGTVYGPIFVAGNIGNKAALSKDANFVTVNIMDGAYLDGNEAKGEDTAAIVQSGETVLNIYDGAKLVGTEAIAMKRGELNINGGTFIGSGAKVDPAVANTNGSEETGAAISVTSTYIKSFNGIKINIVDGTFESVNNAAVYVGHSKNDKVYGYIGDVALDISGGTFTSADGVDAVYIADKIDADTGVSATEKVAEEFVSGGDFSSSVAEYVAPGYEYELKNGSGRFSYYETYAEALKAADNGSTISKISEDGSLSTNYTVKLVYGNGEVNFVQTLPAGSEFILPSVNNSGYIFLGWRCGDATYKAGETVTVNSDMTFTAVWGNLPDVDPEEPTEPEVPDFPFYDVNIRDWYYDAVYYVWDKGLMDGVDTHEFAPNATLTRAMVWTIIARAEGVDTTGGANWYAKAQEWVVAKGISDGENPSAAITRQELVTMLYRLAGEPTVSGSVTAPDAESVSAWAGDAMVWAMNIGLIEGDENGAVTPTATATRAQAAAIFMRYIEA